MKKTVNIFVHCNLNCLFFTGTRKAQQTARNFESVSRATFASKNDSFSFSGLDCVLNSFCCCLLNLSGKMSRVCRCLSSVKHRVCIAVFRAERIYQLCYICSIVWNFFFPVLSLKVLSRGERISEEMEKINELESGENARYSVWTYRKIPKISPRAYICQRPFLRGLFSEVLMYNGRKFAFQNRLG